MIRILKIQNSNALESTLKTKTKNSLVMRAGGNEKSFPLLSSLGDGHVFRREDDRR